MPTARWSFLSKAPAIARSSHALTCTPNGILFLYGGELSPRTPVDTNGLMNIFSLKAAATAKKGNWAALDPSPRKPEPRVGATIVWDERTKSTYVWGGRGGVDMSPLGGDETGLWKGSAPTLGPLHWERVPAANEEDAPVPRSYHSAVAANGKIYIHAGCPASGRLSTLHSFDLDSKRWKALASAPEPGRGGTSIAVVTLNRDDGPVIIRFAGFAGYELGADGALDIYHIASDSWNTVVPAADPVHGLPGARSVHGLVPFTSHLPALVNAVALLYHGERAPSSAGHAGAGEFWDDVWLLERRDGGAKLGWNKVDVPQGGPEATGWFPSAAYIDGGETKVALFGGLLSSNARSDELWLLEID